MPNFIAKKVNFAPADCGDISFLWEARGRQGVSLIFTKSGGEEFFIALKKRENDWVVKGEKLTKPAKIGLLQNALVKFKELYCEQILSEAIAVKNTRLTQKDSAIFSVGELLENLKRNEFKSVFIEIGFGSGRHLLFQAQSNPETLVVGIEVYKPSLEQVAKLAKARNLTNVMLVNCDARLLLSLVESNFVDKIFLHFPVPWDDAPHRRVASAKFMLECERTLKTGGKFELRTDSREYADFTLAQILNLSGAQAQIYKNRDLQISSKYEDRWKKRQKDIYDVIFTCEKQSEPRASLAELKFECGYDATEIAAKFSDATIKRDDFFLHLEEKYEKQDGEILLRAAFGAFNAPEHCYVLIGEKGAEYFIKRPLVTDENLKAHLALKEYLADAKNN